jgi:hypothetical protein
MEISNNITTGRNYSDGEIRGALQQVIRADQKDPGSRPLSEYSRVNEQELFAAFIFLQLKDLGKSLATRFMTKYREVSPELINYDPSYGVYESVRRALNPLKKAYKIVNEKTQEFRRYALGKSQLDSLKDEVHVKRVTEGKADTAVRALKTALEKIKENSLASDAELESFRNKNIARRRED